MNDIKRLRKALGINQQELADIMGVKQAAVSLWESGQAMPRPDKLPELAKILGCSIDDLLKPSESETA